ncbi:MAG TPA: glycogen/starch/alpha-glucan phosphorylase [Verrucomicrobiae bacterium]
MKRPPELSSTPATEHEDVRTGLGARSIARAFRENLYYLQARFPAVATRNDNYMALAYTIRDRLLRRWIATAQTYLKRESRTVCYLSAEFLMGPQLGNNLVNMGIMETVRNAMRQSGLSLDELLEHEEEPGLGNGGLGRLAACFLDSMATLMIPSIAYGIRYEFGIFDQEIRDGWQVEVTDKWLRLGNPWEIAMPEVAFDVKFGGHTESGATDGRYQVRWVPGRVVRGVACDTPVPGCGVNTVNLLRLWKAEAAESLDFQAFNTGDYYRAVMEKIVSENITKVLYPNDDSPQGKQLRLQQQYFFTSCALQDMIRIYRQRRRDLRGFHEKFAVQINDTHPSIAIAELMRLLVDEHQLDWEAAWQVTRDTFGYTNHTLLPEALERWAVPLLGSLLPRHLEIIYEINRRFLDEIRLHYPGDEARVARLSLIDEQGERYVRMAHLACVGSHAINGVAKLHSDLLRQDVLRDFSEIMPAKFTNVTNGVTPRRFLALSNPRLASLITRAIGPGWLTRLEDLRGLEPLAEDAAFRADWQGVKLENKRAFADFLRRQTGVDLDPTSLFDVQVKRLHEYKRQHLNALHVITLYNRLRRTPSLAIGPRSFIFGGKAAPGYFMAKLVIKLINSVAQKVNADPLAQGRIRVAFVPDFNVKTAQRLYPAADLSEQISTAGQEASGTGNMKFALNGAVTIGTLDGANVEIREQVGPENFFLFGLTAPEVKLLKANGYKPHDCYDSNPELREAIDEVRSGFFSPQQPALFEPLANTLLTHDPHMLLADYEDYVNCQERVGKAFLDTDRWTRMSILNVARIGYFSSDRSIREYCEKIWKASPVEIDLAAEEPESN